LLVQATAAGATIVFTAAATWALLKLVNAITPLRMSQEGETEGLDITDHDERGYVL
jgi:Amt family ammonium transporter